MKPLLGGAQVQCLRGYFCHFIKISQKRGCDQKFSGGKRKGHFIIEESSRDDLAHNRLQRVHPSSLFFLSTTHSTPCRFILKPLLLLLQFFPFLHIEVLVSKHPLSLSLTPKFSFLFNSTLKFSEHIIRVIRCWFSLFSGRVSLITIYIFWSHFVSRVDSSFWVMSKSLDLPPKGGFSFDLCRRNEMLENKGLKPPSFLKTGTTIVGLVFQVCEWMVSITFCMFVVCVVFWSVVLVSLVCLLSLSQAGSPPLE